MPIFATGRPNTSDLNAGTVLLLVPLLYAFGMAVDFASNTLLSRLTLHIHSFDKVNLLPDELSETVFINYRSSHLGQALELRSTRDRIARGFFFNLVVATLVVPFCDISWLLPHRRSALFASLVVLTVVAFGAWWRFERLTFRFKKHAARAILSADSGESPSMELVAR